MISLNLENLSAVGSVHGLSKEKIFEKAGLILPFLDKIHARKQGFYKILDDTKIIKKINDFAKKVEGQFEHIVVLGIGGSSLGTICLQQSLKHLFSGQWSSTYAQASADRVVSGQFSKPNLYVLDNIDPALISEIEDVITYEKTLFIVVTKSGTTAETLAQYFYYRNKCDDKNLDPKKHFVFITDPKLGFLRTIANKEKIPAFEIPTNVGGRFSVLTAVGLLPAKLIGINIEKLIDGAKKMRQKFLSEDFEKNLPFQIATIQYLISKKGKIIHVMMPYAQKLIKFADWYRQLLAESIGKAKNNKGDTVNIGITPVNALGVTDQHSQSQLYNEGPNDKFFIFLELEDMGKKLKIFGKNLKIHQNMKFLQDLDFEKLMKTEMHGTIQSLTYNNRPNVSIKIAKIDEKNLGELFMLFESAAAFLGEFFEINAFDQPGVELSKILTKELLK